jgi:hypothetical protein
VDSSVQNSSSISILEPRHPTLYEASVNDLRKFKAQMRAFCLFQLVVVMKNYRFLHYRQLVDELHNEGRENCLL